MDTATATEARTPKAIKMFGGAGNPKQFYHTCKRNDDGTAEITGYCKDIEVGDAMEFSKTLGEKDYHYKVVSIEKRDHRGNFENPEDRKNSFFIAQCTPTREVLNG